MPHLDWYFVTGSDQIGLEIYKHVWEGAPHTIPARAEMLLAGEPMLQTVIVEKLADGKGHGMELEVFYETSLPW